MATRSQPKNFPRDQQPKREQQHDLPGPKKPHPGYPGYGPPVPGNDYEGVTTRLPQGAEKYYPEWSSTNTKNSQVKYNLIYVFKLIYDETLFSWKVAESERLAAERLLHETKELIAETRQKVKSDAKEVDAR